MTGFHYPSTRGRVDGRALRLVNSGSGNRALAGCLLDSPSQFVPVCPSSWDRPKHFTSSSTPSHRVLLRQKDAAGVDGKYVIVIPRQVTGPKIKNDDSNCK